MRFDLSSAAVMALAVASALTTAWWMDQAGLRSQAQAAPVPAASTPATGAPAQVLKAADRVGNVVVLPTGSGEALLTESKRNVVVPAAGRLVAAVGVNDLIIVDTPDAVLVCPRDRAQEVKAVVEELKQASRTDLV